jgi:hypothetical protein
LKRRCERRHRDAGLHLQPHHPAAERRRVENPRIDRVELDLNHEHVLQAGAELLPGGAGARAPVDGLPGRGVERRGVDRIDGERDHQPVGRQTGGAGRPGRAVVAGARNPVRVPAAIRALEQPAVPEGIHPRRTLRIDRQTGDDGAAHAAADRPGLPVIAARRDAGLAPRDEPAGGAEQCVDEGIGKAGARRLPGETAAAAEDAILRRPGEHGGGGRIEGERADVRLCGKAGAGGLRPAPAAVHAPVGRVALPSDGQRPWMLRIDRERRDGRQDRMDVARDRFPVEPSVRALEEAGGKGAGIKGLRAHRIDHDFRCVRRAAQFFPGATPVHAGRDAAARESGVHGTGALRIGGHGDGAHRACDRLHRSPRRAAVHAPVENNAGDRIDRARLCRVDRERRDAFRPAEPRAGKPPGEAAVDAAIHTAVIAQPGIDRRRLRRRHGERRDHAAVRSDPRPAGGRVHGGRRLGARYGAQQNRQDQGGKASQASGASVHGETSSLSRSRVRLRAYIRKGTEKRRCGCGEADTFRVGSATGP